MKKGHLQKPLWLIVEIDWWQIKELLISVALEIKSLKIISGILTKPVSQDTYIVVE